jgi:hypothetical protein
MGNVCTNYTLRGPNQQAVAQPLSGRSAIVTPAQDGSVVVFDEQSDEQDQRVISVFAEDLASTLNCPLLAVLNDDDEAGPVSARSSATNLACSEPARENRISV